jgi:hypothetical protein
MIMVVVVVVLVMVVIKVLLTHFAARTVRSLKSYSIWRTVCTGREYLFYAFEMSVYIFRTSV